MAGKEWSKIEFNKVTSVTLRKQKMAILNKDKKGNKRSEEEDRIQCAANYTKHVEKNMSHMTLLSFCPLQKPYLKYIFQDQEAHYNQ